MINPKLQPVKGKKTYDRIFRTGQRFYHDEASAVICFSREAKEIPQINYAVIVRKKVAKKAVVRNRIKRLLRESLKQIFFESADIKFINSIEYVVVGWNSAPVHPMLIHLKDVLPKVRTLLESAFKSHNKLTEGNGN
ncbi:MAG: ribonuclease P protein component [Ignavibacteria bacterium GWB2_35_12]|nr:MAG: ribonuclease P protein component [Ignavibacteria bacterium GWA2_35_8]OGU42617.1 MAG: ribonuclease P protein component [Ignavibacteria bacterium GWB2_35_12]OGU85745.1 MAG: ribonuclease P protein component [Ignavibacteria bacterium RIFOXYA2_FULL_35_10]OGV19151.1 MAG: ribonuclease P protein component [Ignavibacteria bacterium RIFOXYC2_FULL_35_21]